MVIIAVFIAIILKKQPHFDSEEVALTKKSNINEYKKYFITHQHPPEPLYSSYHPSIKKPDLRLETKVAQSRPQIKKSLNKSFDHRPTKGDYPLL